MRAIWAGRGNQGAGVGRVAGVSCACVRVGSAMVSTGRATEVISVVVADVGDVTGIVVAMVVRVGVADVADT